jgi:hypothetical protein
MGISQNWETENSDRKIRGRGNRKLMPINASYMKINSAYGVSSERSWKGLFNYIMEI